MYSTLQPAWHRGAPGNSPLSPMTSREKKNRSGSGVQWSRVKFPPNFMGLCQPSKKHSEQLLYLESELLLNFWKKKRWKRKHFEVAVFFLTEMQIHRNSGGKSRPWTDFAQLYLKKKFAKRQPLTLSIQRVSSTDPPSPWSFGSVTDFANSTGQLGFSLRTAPRTWWRCWAAMSCLFFSQLDGSCFDLAGKTLKVLRLQIQDKRQEATHERPHGPLIFDDI